MGTFLLTPAESPTELCMQLERLELVDVAPKLVLALDLQPDCLVAIIPIEDTGNPIALRWRRVVWEPYRRNSHLLLVILLNGSATCFLVADLFLL